MATKSTLGDLIERVKQEGLLTRNTGSNSIKTVKEVIIAENQKLILATTNAAVKAATKKEDSAKKAEDKKEEDAKDKKFLSGLSAIGDEFKKTQDKLDKVFNSLAKNAIGFGFLTLLVKPEVFISTITSVITYMMDFGSAVRKMFDGDLQPMFNLFKEHFLATSLILGTIVVKLGLIGKIGKLIQFSVDTIEFLMKVWNSNIVKTSLSFMKMIARSAWTNTINILSKVATALRVFMMGTMIPALTGMLSTLAAAITPILIAAAPFILAGAAIAAGLYGLYKLWNYLDIGAKLKPIIEGIGAWLKEKFTSVIEPLTAVWDKVTAGMGLVGLITAPVRAAGDWIAKKFGWTAPDKEEGFVTSMVKEAFNSAKKWMLGKLGMPPDMKLEEVDLSELYKSILRKVLPDRNGGKLTMGYWLSKGIPEALYNYIGDVAKSEEDFSKNGISGKKIEGGMFGSDKYQLTRNGETVEVSESDYKKMQNSKGGVAYRGLKLDVDNMKTWKADPELMRQKQEAERAAIAEYDKKFPKKEGLRNRFDRTNAARQAEIKFILKNKERFQKAGNVVEGELVDREQEFFDALKKRNGVVKTNPQDDLTKFAEGSSTDMTEAQLLRLQAQRLEEGSLTGQDDTQSKVVNSAATKAKIAELRRRADELEGKPAIKTAPDTTLRDNQVENNDLRSQRDAASNQAAVVMSTSGGNTSNNNVSNSTVNVSHAKDDDRTSRAFVYNPVVFGA